MVFGKTYAKPAFKKAIAKHGGRMSMDEVKEEVAFSLLKAAWKIVTPEESYMVVIT